MNINKMTDKNYSDVNELVNIMGIPKHASSLDSKIDCYTPFTPGVIINVDSNQHGVNIDINYAPLMDFIMDGPGFFGTNDEYESLPLTINDVFLSSLENALSHIGGGTAGVVDQGNPTYGIDQCLGFDYRLDFSKKDELDTLASESIRITQNGDYQEEIDRLDLIAAYAEHLRKAI